jgi:hypothetical protein
MKQALLKCLINLDHELTRQDGTCGQLNLDGKKVKDSRTSTIGLTSKALEIILMLSLESRFLVQISKVLELDLLRLLVFKTPSSVLIKTIQLLGLRAQLEQLDV